MMGNLEASRVATTVERLARLYNAAGPRIGCALVEANVLLVLADLRGTTNFVQMEPTDEDRATVAALAALLDEMGLRVYMMDETRNANGRMCSAVVVESLEGLRFASSRSCMPGVVPFDPASGWAGRETWATQVRAQLRAAFPDESSDLIYDRYIGIALGYPDQAIEDLCESLRTGRGVEGLCAAPIAGVERYRGARPNFSVWPQHLSDPDVQETCATWGQLIEAVYASPWHQWLEGFDHAFLAAREARERTRLFTPR